MPRDMRIGRFRVPDLAITESIDEVKLFLQSCVVLRAERMYYDYIEYVAISPWFREIDEGQRAPYYEIEYEKDAAGFVSIKRVTEVNEHP